MNGDQIINAFVLKLQAQIGQLTVNNALLLTQLEAAQERIRELEAHQAAAAPPDGKPEGAASVGAA